MFLQYTSLINLIQKAFNMGGHVNADPLSMQIFLLWNWSCPWSL